MLRAVLVFALGATAPVLAQESHSGLNGTLESGIYTSATNTFKIPVPVLPELGARISDTDNVVIFKDGFDVLITIGAFPQDATQRWELSTRGIKDYLIYFMEISSLRISSATPQGPRSNWPSTLPNSWTARFSATSSCRAARCSPTRWRPLPIRTSLR